LRANQTSTTAIFFLARQAGRLCFHKPALHKAIVVLRVCSRILKSSTRSVIDRIIRRRLEPAQHMLSEQGEPVTYTEEDQWNLKA
jgi:hypothetical protein